MDTPAQPAERFILRSILSEAKMDPRARINFTGVLLMMSYQAGAEAVRSPDETPFVGPLLSWTSSAKPCMPSFPTLAGTPGDLARLEGREGRERRCFGVVLLHRVRSIASTDQSVDELDPRGPSPATLALSISQPTSRVWQLPRTRLDSRTDPYVLCTCLQYFTGHLLP